MPWTLYFPFATVDDRVTAREHLSVLRQDNAVYRIHQGLAEQGSPLRVEVEFRGGYDEQPLNPDIYERISPFRTPLPERAAVISAGRQSGRSSIMQHAFEALYGTVGRRAGMSTEGANEIIQQYLGHPGGRTQLAASLANPLRQNIDYQGIARRTFMVEQLPVGALPFYDRDPNVVADIVAPPTDPPDFVLPAWVQEGIWVRFRGPEEFPGESGRIAQIEKVLHPLESRAFVRVQTWRVAPPEGCDVIAAYRFVDLWEPCERPPDPRLMWTRLLDEDEF